MNVNVPNWKALTVLALGSLSLVAVVLSRWDPIGPQALLCRHSDDPQGEIDFRVDVGRGEDRVRFADGQTLPVQTSRDQITFLEKETNNFHLNDNDGDEVALGMPTPQQRELGIAPGRAPLVIHPDHRHDTAHRTTIDRRTLRFEEHEVTAKNTLGARMMDGRCRIRTSD
ncbi:MAG: hypothetical protein ACOVNL_12655 [Prochlorococcaceae cyanobacterium]